VSVRTINDDGLIPPIVKPIVVTVNLIVYCLHLKMLMMLFSS